MLGFVMARAAAGEAEILTIAVAPDWQGHGLGRKLMDAVLAKAHRDRIEAVFLEVDETNKPAIALYRRSSASSRLAAGRTTIATVRARHRRACHAPRSPLTARNARTGRRR
jgi:ribosomal protein S18 acetylase RimI-like enzyme